MLFAATPSPAADIDPVLLDAAARIDFGWFSGDENLILAASDTLARRDGDAWTRYLRAYSAYRLAQLRMAAGRPAGDAIDDCREQAELAAEASASATEALVLQAACAALAAVVEPLRSVLHERQLRQAIQRASRLDGDNPRLLLVALQYLDEAEDGLPSAETMLAAFRRQAGVDAFPDWGEAEGLTLLAARQLAAGDTRGARDLVQEALLIAPAYAPARSIETQLRAILGND